MSIPAPNRPADRIRTYRSNFPASRRQRADGSTWRRRQTRREGPSNPFKSRQGLFGIVSNSVGVTVPAEQLARG